MAFLDGYTAPVRVDLGGGYWIDLKPVLTYAEQSAAEKHLRSTRAVSGADGKMQTTIVPDFGAYRFERLLAAVTDWNLDETDGTLWRLEPDEAKRKNIRRLPASVAELLDKRIDALEEAAEEPAERRDFRDQTVGSVAAGDTGAPAAGEVPPGEMVVGEPGSAGIPVG